MTVRELCRRITLKGDWHYSRQEPRYFAIFIQRGRPAGVELANDKWVHDCIPSAK
jgi:hypothetical protein